MPWNLNEQLSGDVVAVAPVQISGAVIYNDARSGAFYALGMAVKKCQPVILVVPGQYLSSTYTAVTEAWFQKANVIVVALFEKVSEVKTAWMDRCVLQTFTFGADEKLGFEHALEAARGIPGPALVNLVDTKLEEVPVDYSSVLKDLRVAVPEMTIWTYHSVENDDYHLRSVSTRDKYGMISRYIGMSVVTNVGILLCPARCALLDMNIFRTRYANKNMKIILLDEDRQLEHLNVALWISSNGWECLESDSSDGSAYKWLVSQQRQAVLIVR